MANAAISYINLADTGTLGVPSSQVATLPISNVLNSHVQRRWRTTANSGNFVIDLTPSAVTFDPTFAPGTMTFSNGNLTVANSAAFPAGVTRTTVSIPGATGKWFASFKRGPVNSGGTEGVGVCNSSLAASATSLSAGGTNSFGAYDDGNWYKNNVGSTTGAGSFSTNDVIDLAVDFTARRAWVRRNGGTWFGAGSSGDPVAGTNGFDWSTVTGSTFYFAADPRSTDSWTANFGTTAYTFAAPSGYSSLGTLASLVDTVGVFGMTMSASGTIRVRLSTSDSTGAAGDAYDSGTLVVSNSYNAHVSLVTSPVIARYVRIDLSDSVGTYVEAGRIFVGARTQFTYNFSYGWQKAIIDRSIRTKTRGGQTQIFLDNHYRSLDLTFTTVTLAQRNALIEEIDRINGLSTDVLFVIDTASSSLARDSIWGLISEPTAVVQPYFSVFSKQFKIEERL